MNLPSPLMILVPDRRTGDGNLFFVAFKESS